MPGDENSRIYQGWFPDTAIKKPPVADADRRPVTVAQPLGVGLMWATLFTVGYRANHKNFCPHTLGFSFRSEMSVSPRIFPVEMRVILDRRNVNAVYR